MEKLSTTIPESPATDGISVSRWLAAYIVFLLVCGGILTWLISIQPTGWAETASAIVDALQKKQTWADAAEKFKSTFTATNPAIKLLTAAVYLSLCTTFLPLPTGWLIAAVATRQAAVGGDLWSTVLLVSLVGAAGSTIANLNDYHLFTWLLRHKRIAAVRDTAAYHRAAAWFDRSPFSIVVIFNVIPIPVDLIRMLATMKRYHRLPFAAANFLGRFIRYGVIAFVTYWWNLGWIAVVALLALAAVMAIARLAMHIGKKLI